MKNILKLCGATVLLLTVAVSTIAGEIHHPSPAAPSAPASMSVDGQMHTGANPPAPASSRAVQPAGEGRDATSRVGTDTPLASALLYLLQNALLLF
jgi:hypothetical protein